MVKVIYNTPELQQRIIMKKVKELNTQEIINLNKILFLYKIRNNEIMIKTKIHTNKEMYDYKTPKVSHLKTEKYDHYRYTT